MSKKIQKIWSNIQIENKKKENENILLVPDPDNVGGLIFALQTNVTHEGKTHKRSTHIELSEGQVKMLLSELSSFNKNADRLGFYYANSEDVPNCNTPEKYKNRSLFSVWREEMCGIKDESF